MIVVVLLAVTAGVYEISGRSARPSGSPGDLSPYGQLFAQVGPNGEVTKEMALEAFSLAIAPLPEVTVPTGAPSTLAERADGTFAVQWIMQYLDQLSPDQRAVVDTALAPGPNSPSNPAPPGLTSMGDAVWFVDTSHADPNTGAGTALTQIDPSTNAPGKSVPLGFSSGCCQDSQGAAFCFCGQSDIWRLTSADSAFVDLGNYNPIYAAGTGFWTLQGSNALFVDSSGGPSVTISLTAGNVGDSLVGGDANAAYLEGEPPDNPLIRQPADGSPQIMLAHAPTSGTGFDQTTYHYGAGGFPRFATPQGYAQMWLFKETPDSRLALWLQWAPLP